MAIGARKPVFGVNTYQRRRPAYAFAQSDQRLCYSLFVLKVSYFNLLQAKFRFSSYSHCIRAGWLGYDLVRNPIYTFSHVEAYVVILFNSEFYLREFYFRE